MREGISPQVLDSMIDRRRELFTRLSPTESDARNIRIMQVQTGILGRIHMLEEAKTKSVEMAIAPAAEEQVFPADIKPDVSPVEKNRSFRTRTFTLFGEAVEVKGESRIRLFEALSTGSKTKTALRDAVLPGQKPINLFVLVNKANHILLDSRRMRIENVRGKEKGEESSYQLVRYNEDATVSVLEPQDQKEQALEKPEILSANEAAFLASVVNDHWGSIVGKLAEKGWKTEDIERAHNALPAIWDGYFDMNSKKMTKAELGKFRQDLLKKVESFFAPGLVDELLDNSSEEVRELIMVLYYTGAEYISNLMENRPKMTPIIDATGRVEDIITRTNVVSHAIPHGPLTGRASSPDGSYHLGSELRSQRRAAELEANGNGVGHEESAVVTTPSQEAEKPKTERKLTETEIIKERHPWVVKLYPTAVRDLKHVLEGVWDHYEDPQPLEWENQDNMAYLSEMIARGFVKINFVQNKPYGGRFEVAMLRYLRNRYKNIKTPEEIEDIRGLLQDLIDVKSGNELSTSAPQEEEEEASPVAEVSTPVQKKSVETMEEEFRRKYPALVSRDPEANKHIIEIVNFAFWEIPEFWSNPSTYISPAVLTRAFNKISESYIRKVVDARLIKPKMQKGRDSYSLDQTVFLAYTKSNFDDLNLDSKTERQLREALKERISISIKELEAQKKAGQTRSPKYTPRS